MIEFENFKDLQEQIPLITEKKLSQLLLVCVYILAVSITNLTGNSNCKQRLNLRDKLVSWWALSDVAMPQLHVAGNREFISFDWFKGLELRGILFITPIPASFKLQLWFNGKIKDRKLGLKIIQRYYLPSVKIV